tara:strand:- start:284 stop:418 length:135 start_codon:yes stop_codon:yes gene_type:complete
MLLRNGAVLVQVLQAQKEPGSPEETTHHSAKQPQHILITYQIAI